MDPVAFEIGRLTIRWYGIFMALAFLAGFVLVQYRAGSKGFSKDQTADLLFWALIGGVVGARLLYILHHWEQFRPDLLEALKIWHGGLVFYGGLAGAALAIIGLSLRHSWSLRQVGDLLAPALPLGQAIGRIGCLLNGCCFGKPWSGMFSISYPPDSTAAFVQRQQGLLEAESHVCLPVFPIQFGLTLMGLLICVLLLALDRHLKTPGRLFPAYLVFYAVGRFLLEFGRGDYLHTVGPFTPAQIVCLLLLPVGIIWFVLAGHRSRPEVKA